MQTVGVSYHDARYYDIANEKGMIIHMQSTYGANQRFPVKVTKGRIPITAAYPHGQARTLWVSADAHWWEARIALSQEFRVNQRTLLIDYEGRPVELNQALPRQTFDSTGHIVVTLRRRKEADAAQETEQKPRPTTTRGATSNPYVQPTGRSRFRTMPRPRAAGAAAASSSKYRAPSPDEKEDMQSEENEAGKVVMTNEEREQQIAEAVDLRLRLKRLSMMDVGTQTDPEVDRNDIDHLRILVPTAGTVIAFVLRLADLPSPVTPADVEDECYRRFGEALECERLCLVDQYKVLDHHAPIPLELMRMATIKAVPSVSQGANLPLDEKAMYQQALQATKQAAQGNLTQAQMRLLLRGERTLAQRVLKAPNQAARLELLRSAANRYDMAWRAKQMMSAMDPPKHRKEAKAEEIAAKEEYQVVQRKKKQSPGTETTPSAPAFTLELCTADWDAPVRQSLVYGEEGVMIITPQHDLKQIARRLQDYPHRFALLTLAPIEGRHSEATTFRAKRTQGMLVAEKLLNGYLTQFGPKEVHHTFAMRTLHLPSAEQATTVLIGRANKRYVNEREWRALVDCTDLKTINALVDEHDLSAIAAFHVQVDAEKYFIKLRIRTGDTKKWLRAPLPLSLAPVGEEGQRYKMIWERDAHSYEDLRARRGDVPGYAGVAESKDGLGIRIEAPQYAEALAFLGRPQGDLYQIQGIPLEVDFLGMDTFLKELGWTATLVQNFRRVFRGSACFRARASIPPPTQAIRANFGSLRAQVQIHKHERTLAEPKEPKPLNPATTWAEVANRSVGRQRVEAPLGNGQKANDYPRRWGGEKEANHDEENTTDGEDEEDEEMTQQEEEERDMESVLEQVEATGEPPTLGANTRYQHPTPKARPNCATPRIDALEKGLGEVRDLLRQLLEGERSTQRMGGSKRQWHQGPIPATAKATLPLPANVHSWTSWFDVPGDGSCLWHTLTMIMQEQWNGYIPETGLQMKTQLLQEMRESRDALGDVLGCSRDAVTRLIQEWEVQHAWGDARTLLAVAYLRAANVLIVDEEDQTLELLSPFGDHSEQTVLWLVRFCKDHFSPGIVQNWPEARKVLNQATLTPWKAQRELRGGGGRREGSQAALAPNPSTMTVDPRPGNPRGVRVDVMQAPKVRRTWVWEREVTRAEQQGITQIEALERITLQKLRGCLGEEVVGLSFIQDWTTIPPGNLPVRCWNGAIDAMPIYRVRKPPGGKQEKEQRSEGGAGSRTRDRDETPRAPNTPSKRERSRSQLQRRGSVGQRRRRYLQRHGRKRRQWPKPISQAQDQMWMGTLNLGGWRSRGADCLQHIAQDTAQHIVALQETHISTEAQKGVAKQVEQAGYRIFFGAPTPWKRVGKRQRLNVGAVPGVCTLVPAECDAHPIHPLTVGGQGLSDMGRLHILMLQTGHGNRKDRMIVINYYGPSGRDGSHKKTSAMQALQQEIAAHNTTSLIVMGDFNEHPQHTTLAGDLLPRGWVLPEMHRAGGWRCTYKCGPRHTSIDGIFVGPDCEVTSLEQKVEWVPGITSHAYVRISLARGSRRQAWPHIPPSARIPPQVKGPLPQRDPIWGRLAYETRRDLEAAPPSREVRQQLVDLYWYRIMELFKEDLRQVGADGVELQNRDGLPIHYTGTKGGVTKKGGTTQLAQRVTRIYHQLAAWAKQAPKEVPVVKKLRGTIWGAGKILGFHEHEIQDALQQPHAWLGEWQRRLEQLRQKEARHAIQHWKKRLWVGLKPKKKLYMWIRGGTMPPPQTLRTKGGQVFGQEQCFDEIRTFWHGVMCNETDGPRQLDAWLTVNVTPFPEAVDDKDIQHFVRVCRQLKPDKAAGLDGWPPEAVRLVGRAQAMGILTLFVCCEHYAMWPTAFYNLRTHLVPKVVGMIPQAQDLRPIALLSCWMRAWSAWRLERDCFALCTNLNTDLIGGVPLRTADDHMASLMLRLERLIKEGRHSQQGIGVISIDASKCFDRVNQTQALEYGLRAKVPVAILRGLGGMMMEVRRFFSVGPFIDPNPVSPDLGILQGDPLSVLLCNLVVETWLEQCRRETIQFQAFVDDRLIVGSQMDELQMLWGESDRWDSRHGWQVNTRKTGFGWVGPRGKGEQIETDEGPLPRVRQLKVIGYELIFRRQEAMTVLKSRVNNTIDAANRLALTKAPPPVVHKVIEIAVIPKLTYGLHHRPPAQEHHRAVRASLRRALGIATRTNSWEMVVVLLATPHRFDPEMAIAYRHLLTFLGAIRKKERTWREVIAMPPPRPTGHCGPWDTTHHYLRKLQIYWEADPEPTLVDEDQRISVLRVAKADLERYLQQRIIKALLRLGERHRTHLEGVTRMNVKVTKALLAKKDYGKRGLLVALVTDALWPRRRKYMAGLAQDDLCPHCKVREDVAHIALYCEKFEEKRGALRRHREELGNAPRCVRECMHCVGGAF